MALREQILELNSEQTNLARTGVSDSSEVATIEVAGDTLAPSNPTGVTANSVPDGVKLDWLNTSLNEDGTTCVDLRWVKIYYSTSTPVITSDSSYVVAARVATNSSFVDSNVGTTTDMYYAISSIDSSGNESDLSSEVTATGGGASPTTDIPTDASGYVFDDTFGDGSDGVGIGYGMLGILFKIPGSGWGNFDRYRLFFDEDDGAGTFPDTWAEIKPINRTAYIHKGLDITHAYKYRASIVAKDGTESDTTSPYLHFDYADGVASAGYTPNVVNPTIFDTTVLAQNLVAVNEVRGDSFYAASYLHVGTGGTEAAAWQKDGVQLQYNGGNPRFYVGDGGVTTGDKYFMFDGTNISWRGTNTSLTTAGAFSASNVSITGGTLNINSGAFIVTSAGAMTCTSATIRGTLYASDIQGGGAYGTISGTYLTGSSVAWGVTNFYDTTNGLDLDGKGMYNCSSIRYTTTSNVKSIDFTIPVFYGANSTSRLSLGTTATLVGSGGIKIGESNQGGDIDFYPKTTSYFLNLHNATIFSSKSLSSNYIGIKVNGTLYYLRLNT